MITILDSLFVTLSSLIGASKDEIKLLSSFLLSYPLAALLKRIPDHNRTAKNVFVISFALFYLVGLFDLWRGLFEVFITAAAAYLISKYIQGPFMPWIGFVFLMSHMAINHIKRQHTDRPDLVDITGAQMVLVMKLTAFCWNVHDGRLDPSTLSTEQKLKMIEKLPSLLDYAGYVLFFPALFAGPAFDYADYESYVTSDMFTTPATVDPSKKPATRKTRIIPRSGKPAATKAVIGLAWIGLFMRMSASYNVPLLLSAQFGTYTFLRKVWILYLTGFVMRMKYYGVWSLTEGACIQSGLGYRSTDPSTGKISWDRLQNVRPWQMETAQNSRAYLENWNVNTNLWLRNYMYLRVTPRGTKPGFGSTLATFATSAFWHGFYPGYYLAFLLASFVSTVAKNCRRHVRPFFMSPDGTRALDTKVYYDVFGFVATQAAFSFTVVPFIVLGFADTIAVWSHLYYYCIFGVAIASAFFASPGTKWLGRRLKEQNARLSEEVAPSGVEESRRFPTFGISDNPGEDLDEVMEEMKHQLAARTDPKVFGPGHSPDQLLKMAYKKEL